ncbi:MAG: RsmF rRNA methyltransferase first C-terminal domain-containing protein [Anaerolineae bacterium]|nr:RsmF rRNA methyltransferase first C-terminal domain-containing protein [Anaerolineae bacterium]
MDDVAVKWPPIFTQRIATWLGEDASLFFDALGKHDVGLRLNSLRGPLASLHSVIPWETHPVPWCDAGLILDHDDGTASKHPYHTAGVYYMQDPSAMAAAVILDPKPDEWILDVAAAPGGKATHIAARMQNKGVLVANDTVRRRTSVLARNIERMGISNTMITNETPDRLASRWAGLFDAVLVDAPCSGESIFARDARSVHDWSLQAVSQYAHTQNTILDQVVPLVRPGGRILYGTCTFAPEENEGVIDAFLKRHQDFQIVALPEFYHLFPGQSQWIGADDSLRLAGRFWPHKGPGHGHFYALLQRRGPSPTDLPERWRNMQCPGRVLKLYEKYMADVLQISPFKKGLFLTPEDDLYIVPMNPKLWSDLRVLRPGLWVAALRHNKINPDHALAMTLTPEEVQNSVNLTVEDPHLRNYLDGSQWVEAGEGGFVLVTVDRFPLGWAKRIDGRLRSRYPVHLRRQ